MPRLDGTGPLGRGAGTGRGLGPCGRGVKGKIGFGISKDKNSNFEALVNDEKNNLERKIEILEEKLNLIKEQLSKLNK